MPNAQTTSGQIEVEEEITTGGEIEADKSQVEELIKSAEVLLESAVVGTTPGCYNVLDKDQFQSSIHKAKKDLAKAQSLGEVDQVGAVLKDAIKRFKASVILKVGDINADGKVDVIDLGLVSYYFRQETTGDTCCEQCKRADIDKNGIIDTIDLSSVATKIFEEE